MEITSNPAVTVISVPEDKGPFGLNDIKPWTVTYNYGKPGVSGKMSASAIVRARTVNDAIRIFDGFARDRMNKIVYSNKEGAIELHDWDFYELTSVILMQHSV